MAPPAMNVSALLEAAMGVFFRFGFRKASMDDVARAAGLSRQALYLKFRSKELLFEAALRHLISRLLDEASAVSAEEKEDLDLQLMAIFDVLRGSLLDAGSRSDAAELLELARARYGDLVSGFERDFIEIVAAVLTRSGVAERWAGAALSSEQLAEHLLMAAAGIKASVSTPAEYRARMSVGIALIARGGPSRPSSPAGTGRKLK